MKKKLLFLHGHLNIGGAEKALVDILRHLDYEKYDVDLLLLEGLGDYAPLLPQQVNVILHPLQNTYGSVGSSLVRCIRRRDWVGLKMKVLLTAASRMGQKHIAPAGKLLLQDRRYDCAIAFRPGICTQLAAFAVQAEHRITWWHHGEIIGNRRDYLEAALACDRVVAVSDSCRDMLAAAFPPLADRLTVAANMLDADTICEKANAFTPYAECAIRHIVSVGRLAPEKHFEHVIYAARKLKDSGLHFRWHLVGDGPLRNELETLAQSLELSDCVCFAGNQVNPYPYIRSADLFVHPSPVESFGIVVAEALTLGVPCVVAKSAGVMDFLHDGENALLTEPNPDDLAEKILQVLADADLREHLRERARCPEQFLPDAVMEKIDSLLEVSL